MTETLARVLFDSNGNAIKVTQDGSDYKYEFLGKLRNAAGTIVNPATEDTLTSADTKLGTIDGVLDSIKDTDGIKKITDELPAGTQEIGLVGQGTKASASGAWPTVLYDASGNPIGVVLDGSVYRLETRTRLSDGTNYQDFIQDTDNGNVWRAQTEALIAPGSTVNIGTGIPSNPADLVIGFCLNGSSKNMLVDGSGTAVNFDFGPSGSDIYAIQELLLVFTADDFEFDGLSFGPNVALTTGINVQTVIDSNVTILSNVSSNEDFLRFPGRPPIVNNTGPKDLLAASLGFGGLVKLYGADGDSIRVTINDDLTSVKFKYLTGTVFATKGA